MTQNLIKTIVEGIQEKKGHNIVIADLERIPTAPANAFVICTAGSPAQADSIVDSVENFTRVRLSEHPAAISGRSNAQWIAMDFGNIMVHVFLPETRDFYDLEHLWDDAVITHQPNID